MATSITEKLQSAIHSGDVVELEAAVSAAKSQLQQHRGSQLQGSNASSRTDSQLVAQATALFLDHMAAAAPYLKPLRRACKELDERTIFDALLRVNAAPEWVRPYMATDIAKAEELRQLMGEAQREARRVLDDSDDWTAVDDFLAERASVLSDRTVLALVQRREDLLKAERRCGGRRRDFSPLLRCSPSPQKSLPANGGGSAVGSPSRTTLSEMGRNTISTSSEAAKTVLRVATQTGATAMRAPPGVRPAWTWTTSASPWSDELDTSEGHRRRALCSAEETDRVQLFKHAMRDLARVQSKLRVGGEEISWERPVKDGGTASTESGLHSSTSTASHTMRHQRASITQHSDPDRNTMMTDSVVDEKPQAPPHKNEDSDAQIVLRGRVPMATPNISPIKISAVHAADISELMSGQHHHSPGSGLSILRPPPPPQASPLASAAAVRDTTTSTSPQQQRAQASSDPSPSPSTSSSNAVSYAARRLTIRLRAALEEEELHRRDIEGTEDFDRAVFLFPVGTRLSMRSKQSAF